MAGHVLCEGEPQYLLGLNPVDDFFARSLDELIILHWWTTYLSFEAEFAAAIPAPGNDFFYFGRGSCVITYAQFQCDQRKIGTTIVCPRRPWAEQGPQGSAWPSNQ